MAVKTLKWSPSWLVSRIPDHYKEFLEEIKKEPSPVHFRHDPRKWMRLPETGEIKRVENIPLPLKYPHQFHEGLWGGEAVVQGFIKKKGKFTRKVPHFWFPNLKKATVYSEILDRYMRLTVTERTLQLIDKHYGFDNYILETPVQDLGSQLAFDIRREMLLTLVRRTMYPDNLEKQESIYQKYKHHVIPEEEAQWFGLSVNDALEKAKQLLAEEKKPFPLKHKYRQELIGQLKELKAEGKFEEPKSTSWLSKLNPFGKQKSLQES